jgi:hypothetical protein
MGWAWALSRRALGYQHFQYAQFPELGVTQLAPQSAAALAQPGVERGKRSPLQGLKIRTGNWAGLSPPARSHSGSCVDLLYGADPASGDAHAAAGGQQRRHAGARALQSLKRIQHHRVSINGAPTLCGVSSMTTEQHEVLTALKVKQLSQFKVSVWAWHIVPRPSM